MSKILTPEYVSMLESIIGKSFRRLIQESDSKTVGTAAYWAYKAKHVLKGGVSSGRVGIVPLDMFDANLVPTYKIIKERPEPSKNYTVSIPTLTIFNGKEFRTIPAVQNYNVGNRDGNNTNVDSELEDLHPWRYSCIIGLSDNTLAGDVRYYISTIKLPRRSALEINEYEDLYESVPATYPRESFIPISIANVTATKVYPSSSFHFTDIVYRPTIQDDEPLQDLFPALNKLEDYLESIDFSYAFQPFMEALNTVTRLSANVSFKEYWDRKRLEIEFRHNKDFRMLYGRVYKRELGVDYTDTFSSNSATMTYEEPAVPCAVEVVDMLSRDQNYPTVSVILDVKEPGFARLRSIIQEYDQSVFVNGDFSTWPDAGKIVIEDDFYGIRKIVEYNSRFYHSSADFTEFTLSDSIQAVTEIKPGARVYRLSEKIAHFNSGSSPAYRSVVVEGQYLGVAAAYATYSVTYSGTVNINFKVRSY